MYIPLKDRLYEFDYKYDRHDRQLGYGVVVDGVNVYDMFNADLIDEPELVSAPITNSSVKRPGKHDYFVNVFNIGDNGIKFRFYVGGETYEEAQKNMNKLVGLFVSGPHVVTVGDTDFEYVCVMTNYSSAYTGVLHYYELSIDTIAIKRYHKVDMDVINSISSGVSFYNDGVVESGMMFVIGHSGCTSIVFTYNDGTIMTMSDVSNHPYCFVDGLIGNVHVGSTVDSYDLGESDNWFINTDLTSFPTVKYGDNNVKVQGVGGQITYAHVIYYPIYLL